MPTLVRPGRRGGVDEPATDDPDDAALVGRRADRSDIGVDPRFAARRAGLRLARRRRRRRTAVVLLALVTVAAALVWVSRTAALDVDAIDVSGNVHTSRDEILARSGLTVGQPLVEVAPADVADRLAALPWVADAEVDRGWTGTVSVQVTERLAAALLADGQGGWLAVDETGRVLAPIEDIDPAFIVHLDGIPPVATGQHVDRRAVDGIAVGRALTPASRSRVARVVVSEKGTVDLVLRPAGVVHLGHPDHELATKAQSLQAVLAQVDLRCLKEIDLREAQQPVLTREPACA